VVEGEAREEVRVTGAEAGWVAEAGALEVATREEGLARGGVGMEAQAATVVRVAGRQERRDQAEWQGGPHRLYAQRESC